MFNLRYHLASLVAVFLSFALGLVLGSVVAERGFLDAQQSALIEGLQADFEDLRTQNEGLSDAYERDRDFAVQLADEYTQGMLDGRTILVIGNSGRSDGLADTNSAILGAGGRVMTAVVSEPGLGLDSVGVRGALASVDSTSVPAEAPVVRALGLLASELATPAPEARPILDAVLSAGVLDIDGLDPEAAIDGVVVLASFDGQADPILVRLAVRLRDAGVAALGVEVSWSDSGVVSACLEAGLSAVDAIDTPQGSLATPLVLSGRAEGHFGVREGAAEPSLLSGDAE
jgi:hypothetical protein